MLAPNTNPPARGLKYLVSALLVTASAAYGTWQNFAQPPKTELRKLARPHIYPPKLAAAAPPAVTAAPEPVITAAAPSAVLHAAAPAPVPAPPPQEAAAPPPLPAMAPPPSPYIAPPTGPHRIYSFADGDYTGDPAECEWGTVQVKVFVRSGAIADVQFLQVPNHRDRSAEISDWAAPALTSEAIKEQNYDVDIVSSATFTSQAFQVTLYSALQQARK